jgi:hypothetical protein
LCSADSLSSSNGISLVGRDIQLGGKLSKKDTLTTVGTNTLTIAGDGTNNPLTVTNLQGGDQNDSIVTITAATGVVRKRTVADVLKATNADTLVSEYDSYHRTYHWHNRSVNFERIKSGYTNRFTFNR